MNDGAVKIDEAAWSGKSSVSDSLRPIMFRRTNSFEFTDTNTGRARVRNSFFLRRGIALANVMSTGHEVSVEENDRLTYLLVNKGCAEIEIGGKVIIARSGQGVLLGTGPRKTKVEKHNSAFYEARALLIPKSALQNQVINFDGAILDKMPNEMSGELAPTTDAFRRLNGYIWYTDNDLLSGVSVTPSDRVAQSTEQLLLDLFGEAIWDAPQLGQVTSAAATLEKVQQAEDFIRANLDQGIQLADICLAVGIAPRSLQLAFQKNRGMSPTATLQRMRLEEIHRRLLNNTSNKSITEIAHECGWAHLGRLSAAFKQRFGQSPSAIRRKGRFT